jgi:hypothetical protein
MLSFRDCANSAQRAFATDKREKVAGAIGDSKNLINL